MTDAEKRREFIESQRFMAHCDQERAKHRDRVLRSTRKAQGYGRWSGVLSVVAIVLLTIGLLGKLLN